MLTIIEDLLDEDRLVRVRDLLAGVKFESGKASAGKLARKVKNNLELPPDAPELKELNDIVMGSLVANGRYQDAVLPHRVAAPFYSCYEAGMAYGEHIDDPIMGTGPRYRSDCSITIFLSDVSEYEGGELCIRTGYGEQVVKPPAGSAVIYPSSSVHRVNAVTRGRRLAAVTWVQSLVREADHREILFDMAAARNILMAENSISEAARRLDHAYVNLLRLWSDL